MRAVHCEHCLSSGWSSLICALLLVGVLARATQWFNYSSSVGDYYPHIYYATVCRFDEFLPGIAVAMLKNFHRPIWERITRHGQSILAIGTVAVATILYCEYQFHYIEGQGYPFFMTAAGYSLNAMAFALLVVAALSPGSWLARIRIPGAYHIALWSYSIYLSHKAVQMVLERELRPLELPSIALACIIAATSVLVGGLLYRLVESPFMALRDRWVPSNFAEARQRASVTVYN
jgi:peptidoglycan/LPS O-acetylase OafA/YrhL